MVPIGFPTQFEADPFLSLLDQKADYSRQVGIPCYSGRVKGIDVAVGIVGIGARHAPERSSSLFRAFPGSTFVLAGLAGGLIPELQRGQILVAQQYSSDELINYIKLLSGFDVARLHTASEVVSTAADKARLASSSGCQFVDMETSAVAPVIQSLGAEIMAVRSIGDLAGEDVPVDLLSRGYNYEKGETNTVGMSLYLATHPWAVGRLRKFLADMEAPRQKLGKFLVELVSELP